MQPLVILPGQAFGKLVVVSEVPKRGKYRAFRVRCSCGNQQISLLNNLRAGRTKSCGCGSRESNLLHGMWRTPTHNSWAKMHARCLNPNFQQFKDYGGRGITICPRWRLFEKFLADMGERPTGKELDRIDNNGNYEPGNCRWATHAENMQHTRRSLR